MVDFLGYDRLSFVQQSLFFFSIQGDQLRLILLHRYFGRAPLLPMECLSTAVPVSHGPGAKFIARAQMTLFAIQCHLDSQGASKLIVDLVVNSFTNNKIFSEVS